MAIDLALIEASSTTHAEDLRRLFKAAFLSAGVMFGTDLDVTQRGAGANMSVDVAAGQALVDDGQAVAGLYPFINTATVNVPLDAADPTNPRIDIIVARVRDAQYSDAGAPSKTIEKVTGTPAASPSVPATPARSLKLAEVAVAAGATSIVNANITEKRVWAGMHEAGWGQVGKSTLIQTGPPIVGTTVDVNGSSITVTTKAARRYRYLAFLRIRSDVAGDVLTVYIDRDGVNIGPQADVPIVAANRAQHVVIFQEDAPPAGSHTYKMRVARGVGSGNGVVEASGPVTLDDIAAAAIT